MKLLENKIVLITGGSRGIGKSIAQECLRQGATIAFTYRDKDTEDQAILLENELTEDGGRAKAFMSDAASFEDAQKLVVDVIAEFGTLDVLVNNAGITRDIILAALKDVRGNQRVTSQSPEDTYQSLKKYGRDLNELAKANKSPPWVMKDLEDALKDLKRGKCRDPEGLIIEIF